MDEDLLTELAGFELDPYGFVIWAFPWGEEGSELEEAAGPEPWQTAFLKELGEALRSGVMARDEAVVHTIQMARTSGHGVGKSALVSWIILWAMSTFPDTVGVVTANTETQLKTKTWVQLATWYRRFIARGLFKLTATALFSVDPEHEKTWRMDMVPWSERNTEAFAGLHNKGRRILVVFDEASAIPDVIWEVTEGALTDKDTQIIWAVFGNPTRNSGRFRQCFPGGAFAHRWRSAAVDSRQVSITDKAQIKRWEEDYGEDSDFFRVRVKGEFPRVDAVSFIPESLAYEATAREIEPPLGEVVVVGVDVGRFGDDPSVIYCRKGRDGRTIEPQVFYGLDTMQLVSRIVLTMTTWAASIVYVDEGGVGGGVVDRLRQLNIPVIGVDFGSKPDYAWAGNDMTKYANKRAEMWGTMREWLKVGAIPHHVGDINLVVELSSPTYGFNKKDEILLESKQDMKKRNVGSPNVADALALTFAFPTYTQLLRGEREAAPLAAAPDWDPFEKEHIYGVQ
jgi:hypothetical protein